MNKSKVCSVCKSLGYNTPLSVDDTVEFPVSATRSLSWGVVKHQHRLCNAQLIFAKYVFAATFDQQTVFISLEQTFYVRWVARTVDVSTLASRLSELGSGLQL